MQCSLVSTISLRYRSNQIKPQSWVPTNFRKQKLLLNSFLKHSILLTVCHCKSWVLIVSTIFWAWLKFKNYVPRCAHLIPDQMPFTQGRHAFVLEVNLVPCLCQLHVVGKELCSGKIAQFWRLMRWHISCSPTSIAYPVIKGDTMGDPSKTIVLLV